ITLDQEGNYTFILNITNSLNRTRIYTSFLIVDHTAPTVSISQKGQASQGMIEITINVEDENGILITYIDWGDGLVQDVTNMTEESHTYRKSGEYQITLVSIDKAGNIATTSINVTISLPTTTETPVNTNPIGLVSILSAIAIVPFIGKKRKP
ncbi:MAG: hypothetical protein D6732_08650, partial [Methanobacteriota archaeon]